MSDLTDLDLDLDEGSTEPESADPAVVPPSASGGRPSRDEKRLDDLMSRARKAEARAEALQKQLDGIGKAGDAPAPGGFDGESYREDLRDMVFESDPRLEQYGFEPGDIVGDNRREMRASAARLLKRIEAIEAKAKSAVLAEHGLSPEATESTVPRQSMPDFGSMSSEEFKKYVASALGRSQ